MITTPPFILHILVADGDPDGLGLSTYQQKLSELAVMKKAVLGAAFRGEL